MEHAEYWPPKISKSWRRETLSVSKSLISTNWPERTLSTTFYGNGAVAGDKLKPDPPIGAETWWALRRFEVLVAAHGMVPAVPGMGTDGGSGHDKDEAVPAWVLTGKCS